MKDFRQVKFYERTFCHGQHVENILTNRTGRRIFVQGKFLKSSDRDKGLIYIVDLVMEDLLKEFRQ